MTLQQVATKVKLRLNKGDSGDYDNFWMYQIQEAFQKAISGWVRRQIHGKNVTQEGDEESLIRTDDLQILLKTEPLNVTDKGIYVQTEKLPTDYIHYKRLTPTVSKGKCSNVQIRSYLREEANVDQLLNFPSFDFEETFHTLIGNRAHIYHNKDFVVEKALLTYYRKPKTYDFKKLNSVVEFNDEICDILVDETARILASDIESLNQKMLAQEREQTDN